jgi:HK97 family phage portal protein
MWFANQIKSIVAKTFWIQTKSFSWSNLQSIASLLNRWYTIDLNTYYMLYQYNGDIRQAVQKISNWVSRNGIYLEDNQNQTVEDNVITDEVYSLFQAPTFLKWKKELYKNYMLSWNLYILPVRNEWWLVIWFDILDSRMVSKQTDPYGVIQYFYVSTQWKTVRYRPQDIAYFKREDSVEDSTSWMWILNWCVYDALSDLEAMKVNYSFYQNSAIPSALLVLDDELSDEEIQNAKDQFDARFKWSENQHKTMVMKSVKDFKTISFTARDMEFINQRHLTTEKVSAVFGVPKSILWYVESVNYANGENQRKEFIEWTLRPLESDFEHILNRLIEQFRPDLFKKYRIKCDWEQLEETQERMEWLRKDVQCWIMTINEARIERWFEPVEDENADKPLVSRNVVLLEDIALDPILSLDET